MTLVVFYAILAMACVIWNVATSIVIYENLRRRGIRVSFLWLRLMAPFYAHRYRKITREEIGRTGPLYYHWIVSINSALVLGVVAILLKLEVI